MPRLLLLALALLPLASLPAAADTQDYRPLDGPLPPLLLPPVSVPPFPALYDTPVGPPAVAPCFVDGDGALHCTPVLAWEAAVASWGWASQGAAASWAGAAAAATVAYATGLDAEETAAAAAAAEFVFLGPAGSTTATIHVHDAVGEGDTVFAVKGGPSGQRWFCKHSCSVPVAGFRVSVDPQDVPDNIWLGREAGFPLPNLPAASGTITVTFS